jgi:O-antigen/teichoic acid export membrane protein
VGEIRKQGIANSVITYTGIIIGFLNIVVIQPNFLQPEELGLTRILFSFSALIATVLPLGIGNVTIKFFPLFRDHEKRHNGYFGFLLLAGLLGFLIFSGLLSLLKPIILNQFTDPSSLLSEFFQMIFPLMLFLSFNSILSIYSYSLFKTSFPSFLNDILIRIFSIAVVSAYYMKWLSFDNFVLLFVMVYGIQSVILILYIFLVDKPGFRINFSVVRQIGFHKILKYGLVMSVASLSSLGLRYIDTIFVGKFLDLTMVAIYSVAALIPTIIEAPLVALEKITSPKIADAWSKNRLDEIKKIYYDSSLYLLIFGGLIFIGININIQDLLKIIPKDYSLGINVVFLLSLSTMFNMATGVNNSVIYNSEYYRYGVGFVYFLIVLTVITNLLLIPLFGLEGAALATMISGFLYNTLKFLFIRKKFGMNPFNNRYIWLILIILAVLIIGFTIPSVNNGLLDILIRSFIVSILYVALVYYMKVAPELYALIREYWVKNVKQNKLFQSAGKK